MTCILIEGVSGSGKSQTLQALMHHKEFPALLGSGRVFPEEDTFGEVMSELQQPGISNERRLRRLTHTLELIEGQAVSTRGRSGFVLERFHLSYYVLLPEWNLYADFDARLARLNCLIVLLSIPEEDIATRCLDRKDRAGTSWTKDMIAHYGSRESVLDAIIQSVRKRRNAAQMSRLPLIEIETGLGAWSEYANKIVEVWKSRSRS
ncbi:MAG TPA: hypothetical protein VFO86_02775 [Terriglobia bacterium]|nr:hypothetical protein [Terriglobia bacterium]